MRFQLHIFRSLEDQWVEDIAHLPEAMEKFRICSANRHNEIVSLVEVNTGHRFAVTYNTPDELM